MKAIHSSGLYVVSALAVAGALLVGATSAQAQPQEQALTELLSVQNAMADAAVDAQFRRFEDGAATITSAVETLDGVLLTLENDGGASIPAANLKKAKKTVRKTVRKAKKAGRVMSGKGKLKKRLAKLRAVSKLAFKAMAQIGFPLLGSTSLRSGAFLPAGTAVSLDVQSADGSPCVAEATVDLANEGFGDAVDQSSVSIDAAGAKVSFRMGSDTGVGHVAVTACGRSAVLKVFNLGSPTPKGVPAGFPTNLPDGLYDLRVTLCQKGRCDPETTVATLDSTSAEELIRSIKQSVVIIAPAEVKCGLRWQYVTPFDGTQFAAALSLTCRYQGQVVLRATVRIRLVLVS